MKVPFVDLGRQHRKLTGELRRAIDGVIERGDFILGEELERFEQEFAAFCGVRHALGVDSGVSALELALRAIGVGPGDEVVTVANTFIATVSAIAFTGACPILVDIQPDTLQMDVTQLERVITPRTRAIIPVHLYGCPVDAEAVTKVAAAYDLAVIEDACQAHGARVGGRRVGSLGTAAAFSFYPSKNLGAFGDGGILVTDDGDIAERVRVLRNYGQREKYRHECLAYNRRLDTLQAAVLRVKLPYLDEWNARRRAHAARYDDLLRGTSVVTPVIPPDVDPVYHLYVVRSPERERLRQWLEGRGVKTGIHYPIPPHRQLALRHLPWPPGGFPVAERVADEILSLPMFPELTPQEVTYVADAVRAFDRR